MQESGKAKRWCWIFVSASLCVPARNGFRWNCSSNTGPNPEMKSVPSRRGIVLAWPHFVLLRQHSAAIWQGQTMVQFICLFALSIWSVLSFSTSFVFHVCLSRSLCSPVCVYVFPSPIFQKINSAYHPAAYLLEM